MPVRTFLAVDLDEAVLDRLAEAQRAIDDPAAKLKWVERENLHVTLNFLGDVPDDLLGEVCSVAASAAAEVQPFEFHVRGLLCVPPAGRQLRMIWAGIEDAAGRLVALQARLAEGFGGLGLRQEERGYLPHVTLGRIRFVRNPEALRRAAARHAQTHFGMQHAEELVTYSSTLTSDGPVYAALARAKLGG